MVKKNNYTLFNIIGIILTFLVIYWIVIKNNILFAEEITQKSFTENQIIELKKALYNILLTYINTEEFKIFIIKKMPQFYPQFIINKEDINIFVENLPWLEVYEKYKLNQSMAMSDIFVDFVEYANSLIRERFLNYLQKNEHAYINTIYSCNNIIIKLGVYIKENSYFYYWTGACVILGKMYIGNSIDLLYLDILKHLILNPLHNPMEALIKFVPRLSSYIYSDNLSLEIYNINSYIFTQESKKAAQNAIKEIVNNSDSNIVIIGSIIGIGLFVGFLKMFTE